MRYACKCVVGSLEKSFCSEDESWPCLKFAEQHFTHHRAIQPNHRQDEEVKKKFSWLNFQNRSWKPACFEKLCVLVDSIHSFHSLDWKKTGKLSVVLQFSFLFLRMFCLPLPFPVSLQDIEWHHHRKVKLDCEETKIRLDPSTNMEWSSQNHLLS